MKLWLFLFLSVCLFTSPRSVFAYDDSFCPEHVTSVKIDNRVLTNRLKYVHNKSVSYLSSIQDSEGGEGLSFGYSPQVISDETAVETISDDNGCFKEIIVNVIIDFLDPTIYIASELPSKSPEFNYVFWHESEHARITVENNKRYLPYLEQELKRYVSGIRVHRPTTPQEEKSSKKYIYNKVTAVVMKNIEKINDMIETVNKEFDAREHKYDVWLYSSFNKKIKGNH